MTERYITLTREQLYDYVWSRPATQLAKEWGISDVAIAKTCRRLNVPKPGPGYWRFIEVGARPKKPPLPKAGGKLPAYVTLGTNAPHPLPELAADAEARIQAAA